MAQQEHTFAIPTSAPAPPPPLTSYGPRTYGTQLSCFASVSHAYMTDAADSVTRASPVEYTSCATIVLSQAPVVSWQSIITLSSRHRSTVWLTASNPAYIPDALLTASPTSVSIVNTWVGTPTVAPTVTATETARSLSGSSMRAGLEGGLWGVMLPVWVLLVVTIAVIRRGP